MSNLTREQISTALIQAMGKEDLNTRAAAKFLNLNPCYVSMARNPKSWDSMGKTPWVRLEEWVQTREALKLFSIPEGEEEWKPKEKAQGTEQKAQKQEQNAESGDKKAGSKIKLKFITAPIKEKKKKDTVKNEEIRPAYTHSEEYVQSLICKITDLTNKLEAKPAIENIPIPDPTRVKIAMDIEINLVVNGQRVTIGG
jgi:hypothetical protein